MTFVRGHTVTPRMRRDASRTIALCCGLAFVGLLIVLLCSAGRGL